MFLKKKNYQGWRHGATKESIWKSAIGMKSRFMGDRFLKQTKNRTND